MDARLFQRVGVPRLIENIRLGLRKVDEHSNRLADESLNLVHYAALKLPPVNPHAYSSRLLGRIPHGDEKHVLVLRRKRHGSKDKLVYVRRFGRV